ncbi:MAG: hypothetical protein QM703_12295 [Gemmatales bacterium]
MSSVLGTIRNGKVKLDKASPWPEGRRVKVDDSFVETVPGFMTEEEQGTDPESIARWIAMVDAQDVITITDEEADRMEREIKEFGQHSLITDQDISDFLP